MRRFLPSITGAVTSLFGTASGQEPSVEQLFDSFKWNNRVLVVFADDPGAQIGLIDAEGYAERKLVVISSDRRRIIVTRFDEDAEPSSRVFGGRDSITNLVSLLDPPDDQDPHILLIGLDGSVKQRWAEPVLPGELYAVIDAMPIRQSEIENRE